MLTKCVQLLISLLPLGLFVSLEIVINIVRAHDVSEERWAKQRSREQRR